MFRSFLKITALSLIFTTPAFAQTWATVATPSQGEPQVIGDTNNGCIAGAHALPTQGDGYLVVHLERHRYFGHPNLIQTLQELGKQAQQQHLGLVQIGDLGQARGGLMPFGHRSHQSGLDADVWFNLDPKIYAHANELRSNIKFPSMLIDEQQGINHDLWTDKHIELLRITAQLPEIDRIFVNPHIKKELCDKVTENREWLHKIRPWFFHDDHLHLRLRCPEDSPDCKKQGTIPAGDGCGSELMSWFPMRPIKAHGSTKPKPPMPKACAQVLTAP
jgi:penicillin-insensitive murein endopeptidase